MAENLIAQLGDGQFAVNRQRRGMDYFGGVDPTICTPRILSVFLSPIILPHRQSHPRRALCRARGAGICRQRVVILSSLLFAQADRSDLGMGEDHRRAAEIVDFGLLAEAVVDRNRTIVSSGVGQQDLAPDIADGINVLDISPHVLVGDNRSALIALDPDFIQPHVFGIEGPADRDQHLVGLDLLTVDVAVIPFGTRRDRFDFGLGVQFNLELFQFALDQG